MNYKVGLILTIYNLEKTKLVSLTKRLTMPFVPFIGLSLSDELGGAGPIVSVSWSIQEQTFTCNLESCESECDDGSITDMDFLVSEAKENGWEGSARIYDI